MNQQTGSAALAQGKLDAERDFSAGFVPIDDYPPIFFDPRKNYAWRVTATNLNHRSGHHEEKHDPVGND